MKLGNSWTADAPYNVTETFEGYWQVTKYDTPIKGQVYRMYEEAERTANIKNAAIAAAKGATRGKD